MLGRVCADLRPIPAGASTEHADGFARDLGGSAANVAVALARLGLHPTVVGGVGDDAHGRYLRRALEAEGVDCDALTIHPTLRTPLAFCDLSDPERPRVLLQRGETAPDWETGPEALEAVDLVPVRLVVAAGTMLFREPSRRLLVAALSRSGAALRVLDLDWRPGLWGPGDAYGVLAREAAARADVVVGSPNELAAAAGGGPAALLAVGPRVVVEKRGPEGATVHVPGRAAATVAVPAVVTRDALGPGDALVAAIAWRLLAGDDPVAAVRVGCRAGAHVAARVGCASVMPTTAELA